MGVLGLAWGTVVGAILHIAIQVPALLRYRFRYLPVVAWRLRGVHEVARLMGPRIVTLGVTQVADLFVIRLASGLATGATSAYFYAYSLMQLPETLFGTAIALVVFPTLAELYNAGDIEGLKRTAANSLAIIWSLTIPAAVGMAMLGRHIVALLLEGGAFDADSTQLVYTVLIAFSVRIVSEATLEIVARLFYARHNTLTPMFAYAGWLLVTVAIAYLLVDTLSIAGLALATTIGFTLLSSVLFFLNWRELGGFGGRTLARSLGRTLIASAVMAGVLLVIDQSISNTFVALVAGVVLGGGAYLLVVLALGGREVRGIIQLLRRRTTEV
jgi:putative peptidoglycan lipid II flippase